jgi:hypothetical protein
MDAHEVLTNELVHRIFIRQCQAPLGGQIGDVLRGKRRLKLRIYKRILDVRRLEELFPSPIVFVRYICSESAQTSASPFRVRTRQPRWTRGSLGPSQQLVRACDDDRTHTAWATWVEERSHCGRPGDTAYRGNPEWRRRSALCGVDTMNRPLGLVVFCSPLPRPWDHDGADQATQP